MKANYQPKPVWLLASLLLLAACAKPSAVNPPAIVVTPEPVPAAVVAPTPPSRDELLAQYIDKVRRLIRAQMRYTGRQGNPETLLEVTLQDDLRVKTVRIVQASTNRAFDQAVKRAVEKAGRYPPLPEGLEASLFMTHKIKYRLHDLL